MNLNTHNYTVIKEKELSYGFLVIIEIKENKKPPEKQKKERFFILLIDKKSWTVSNPTDKYSLFSNVNLEDVAEPLSIHTARHRFKKGLEK